MKENWNERFASAEYIYGTLPNTYFKEKLSSMAPGKLLLPAEGEGRNAVFAALSGWQVTAMDFSDQARIKAMKLAESNGVTVDYIVEDMSSLDFGQDKYDAAALIYAHMPPETRQNVHRRIVKSLKPGGYVIMEAFSKKQIRNTTGGPKTEELLYTVDILRDDFEGLEIFQLEEVSDLNNQGIMHRGRADMIRLFARKPL